MAVDRRQEVDVLYKKAQRILLHELTDDERAMILNLGIENHATVSDEKLERLRELVRTKGHKQSADS